MTGRPLASLFQETVAGEPPLRDLVVPAVTRGRFERRRARWVGALAVAAAAVLVVGLARPAYQDWTQTLAPMPANAPAVPVPDRYLPVPAVPEGASPVEEGVAVRELWAAVRADPYADYDPRHPETGGMSGRTGTEFAQAVAPLIGSFVAPHEGLALGYERVYDVHNQGTDPLRWMETWIADDKGVNGVWIQQWDLRPAVWSYCTTRDEDCRHSRIGDYDVVSASGTVDDPITQRPVTAWWARATSPSGLMIVVLVGPRTRAGVTVGPPRAVPLMGRAAVESLAVDAVALGY